MRYFNSNFNWNSFCVWFFLFIFVWYFYDNLLIREFVLFCYLSNEIEILIIELTDIFIKKKQKFAPTGTCLRERTIEIERISCWTIFLRNCYVSYNAFSCLSYKKTRRWKNIEQESTWSCLFALHAMRYDFIIKLTHF